jgi:hypothetical protein
MTVSELRFTENGVEHCIELERNDSGYIIKVDGQIFIQRKSSWFGFTEKFLAFNCDCFVRVFTLGSAFRRYKISAAGKLISPA